MVRVLLILGLLATPLQARTIDEVRAIAAAEYAKFTPGPAPTPKPNNGVCPDCNGTGRVGDGTVFQTCLNCNGTGKVTTAMVVACGNPSCSCADCGNGVHDPNCANCGAKSAFTVVPPFKQDGRWWCHTQKGLMIHDNGAWVMASAMPERRSVTVSEPVYEWTESTAFGSCANGQCSPSQRGRVGAFRRW